MVGPGGGGVQRGGRRVAREGQGEWGGLGGCWSAVYSGLLGARAGCPSSFSRSLWRDWRRWDQGHVGLEEGVCSLLAGLWGRLHSCLRAVARDVG